MEVLYILASVFIISLISLIGIITLSIKTHLLRKYLTYMVSFSAGAMFGDAFIHLLPEVVNEFGFTVHISLYILAGILFAFLIEKVIHWRHCHHPTTKEHVHPFAWMNIVGDCVHNFIDGLIIGASYLASIPAGIATTLAVALHEIPQEIGDFGILLHGGFSKGKALLINFLTAATAFLGAIAAILVGTRIENATVFLLPFAAGTFIYIAGADLIPEMHKEVKISHSIAQTAVFVLGIVVMAALLLLEI